MSPVSAPACGHPDSPRLTRVAVSSETEGERVGLVSTVSGGLFTLVPGGPQMDTVFIA